MHLNCPNTELEPFKTNNSSQKNMNVIMSDTEEKICSFFSKMYLSFQCLGISETEKKSFTIHII